ncbi:hypothetical protein I3760_04G103200 [Carya illinoinensis]|nr:hypothetical protein I3760_04G103200 [Carya illinoinensis]
MCHFFSQLHGGYGNLCLFQHNDSVVKFTLMDSTSKGNTWRILPSKVNVLYFLSLIWKVSRLLAISTTIF